MILRFSGFSLSYILIYISRPKKILGFLKNIFKRDFLANNIFEQRLRDIFSRIKLNKETKKEDEKLY